jgi:hypothetical protein
VTVPETRHTKTADGVHIAYHVAGEGRRAGGHFRGLGVQTVQDLVAGSGPGIEDAGEHELKAGPTAGAYPVVG